MAQAAEERSARRRSGGGRRAAEGAPGSVIPQLPWKQPRRPFPPVDLLSADEIESIHTHSLTVLEDLGMEVYKIPSGEVSGCQDASKYASSATANALNRDRISCSAVAGFTSPCKIRRQQSSNCSPLEHGHRELMRRPADSSSR